MEFESPTEIAESCVVRPLAELEVVTQDVEDFGCCPFHNLPWTL